VGSTAGRKAYAATAHRLDSAPEHSQHNRAMRGHSEATLCIAAAYGMLTFDEWAMDLEKRNPVIHMK